MTDQPHCPKWWTVEQKLLLEKLHADNVDWPEIAVQCGHTVGSCRVKLHDIVARRAVREDDKPAKAKKERRPWSETDVAELIHLTEIVGLKFREIDRKLERSNGSCGAKYEGLRRGSDPKHQAEAGDHVRVPLEQQAVRDALKQAQNRQSPISQLLGEPPPGYSALDQKRATGEAPR